MWGIDAQHQCFCAYGALLTPCHFLLLASLVAVAISSQDKSKAYPEVWENAPQPHYMGSTVMVGLERGVGTDNVFLFGQSIEPQILLFGGDQGITRNKYTDDLRSLKLRNFGADENDSYAALERDETCGWRLQSGSTAYNHWVATCGSGGSTSGTECEVEEILIRAYCTEAWQDISNLM